MSAGAQERGVRRACARAADDFPLLVGAPGSQAQLVLTAMFLQIEAVPLIDGSALNRLAADPRVAGLAPIAFGDRIGPFPVIGTSTAFASRWGRLAPSEGRLFQAEDEAVLGADVPHALGARLTPSHGVHAPPAADDPAHRHDGVEYTVVGRLPRLGSPWDRAILVPIETVWETHGLGNGHSREGVAIGPPFDAPTVPGVPAIVVRPRSVADAYTLRAQWRSGGTMAFFPAEVLVSVYRGMGDLRDLLVAAAALNNFVVFLAILLLAVTLVGTRRRRIALLRALGATRGYILLVTWLGTATLITAGCVLGLALGWLASAALGAVLAARTGLAVPVEPALADLAFAGGLALAGSLAALLPALAAWRTDPSAALRSGA
jgi:putative ABC transport system permease protein